MQNNPTALIKDSIMAYSCDFNQSNAVIWKNVIIGNPLSIAGPVSLRGHVLLGNQHGHLTATLIYPLQFSSTY